MTATTAADYPALGFDPTPGDPAEVASLADTLSGVASALGEIATVLRGADAGEWRGHAAVAFRDLLDDDLRPKIDTASRAFTEAHRQVASWRHDLDDFQARARRLERWAHEAQARGEAAVAQLNSLPAPPAPGAAEPSDPAAARRLADEAAARAQNRATLSRAGAELETLRGQARALHGEYVDAGTRLARLLEHAVHAAPKEPGWLDSVVDSIGGFIDSVGDVLADLGDLVVDFLHSIAPLLKVIGDVAGLLSTVLGLLAFVPGLQLLAVPALVLGGLGLLAHYASAVGSTGSFVEALTNPDVVLDAVGLALGLGSLKLGGRLVEAARASGNVRMVPQLLTGREMEVPYGFFSIAKGAVTSMEFDEMVVRTVALHVTWAGFGVTGAGGKGIVDTARKLATWDFGPLRLQPVTQ